MSWQRRLGSHENRNLARGLSFKQLRAWVDPIRRVSVVQVARVRHMVEIEALNHRAFGDFVHAATPQEAGLVEGFASKRHESPLMHGADSVDVPIEFGHSNVGVVDHYHINSGREARLKSIPTTLVRLVDPVSTPMVSAVITREVVICGADDASQTSRHGVQLEAEREEGLATSKHPAKDDHVAVVLVPRIRRALSDVPVDVAHNLIVHNLAHRKWGVHGA